MSGFTMNIQANFSGNQILVFDILCTVFMVWHWKAEYCEDSSSMSVLSKLYGKLLIGL